MSGRLLPTATTAAATAAATLTATATTTATNNIVGLQPSSLQSTGCVGSLRGDWAIFCHADSGLIGRV